MIAFYRTAEKYGGFSNFSKHPVSIYGLRWATSEHAFQAMKFSPHRVDLVREIWALASPREAANRGRDHSLPLHEGWEKPLPEQVSAFRLPDAGHALLQPHDGRQHEEPLFNRLKDFVMYEVVYAKMTQHPELRALLLETGTEPIVEGTPKDPYWGRGAAHDGENKLGRILMAIRAALVEGALTKTAFGKPDRATFICAAGYPWRPEYGEATHPDATSTGRVSRECEGFECTHCGHYLEVTRSAV